MEKFNELTTPEQLTIMAELFCILDVAVDVDSVGNISYDLNRCLKDRPMVKLSPMPEEDIILKANP